MSFQDIIGPAKEWPLLKRKLYWRKMPYTLAENPQMSFRFRKRTESYSVYGCSTLIGLAKDASGF